MMYYEMHNIGTVKYVVNYHDGTKKHNDGSAFYDIRTFSNKRLKEQFVKSLIERGYKQK